MARKKTVWGKPGETGVTEDGIPWYVPEKGPSLMSRALYSVFPGGGTYMPAGALFVPARTSAEVRERCERKYGESIAKLLDEGEELHGFADFGFDENIPQPPRGGIEAKIGPNPLKHWWMGGGWDTMAGELVTRFGGSRYHDLQSSGVLYREMLWIRTSRRILIMGGTMEAPVRHLHEYALDQVGICPGWQPQDPAHGDATRVDIAFADRSWLGVSGVTGSGVPGGCENQADRDLLVELVGPAVTADVLPALGRG